MIHVTSTSRDRRVLRKAVVEYNVVLLPLVVVGLLLVFASRGENTLMLGMGIVLTVLSPFIAYLVLMRRYRIGQR